MGGYEPDIYKLPIRLDITQTWHFFTQSNNFLGSAVHVKVPTPLGRLSSYLKVGGLTPTQQLIVLKAFDLLPYITAVSLSLQRELA